MGGYLPGFTDFGRRYGGSTCFLHMLLSNTCTLNSNLSKVPGGLQFLWCQLPCVLTCPQTPAPCGLNYFPSICFRVFKLLFISLIYAYLLLFSVHVGVGAHTRTSLCICLECQDKAEVNVFSVYLEILNISLSFFFFLQYVFISSLLLLSSYSSFHLCDLVEVIGLHSSLTLFSSLFNSVAL